MPRRPCAWTRKHFAQLAALALVAGGCARPSSAPDKPAAPLPAAASDSLPVSLATQVRETRAGDRLPVLTFSGGPERVDLVWELRSMGCMLATATALRGGTEVEVRIRRGGDPLALCGPTVVVYRYEVRVEPLEAGRYRVRVVEDPAGREIGAGQVTVLGAGG